MVGLAALVLLGAVACEEQAAGYESSDTYGPALGAGGQVGGVAPVANGIPCEVNAVVNAKCRTCHSAMPAAGAFPLMTQADFQGMRPDGGKVHEAASRRVNDPDNPMPPPRQPALTEAEKHTLNTWLNASAPYTEDTCDGVQGNGSTGGGGIGSTGGGVAEVVADECFVLSAYNSGGSIDQPFQVGLGEAYTNFTFPVPWQQEAQVVSIRHLIDNHQVVHHTLLYQSTGALQHSVAPSNGTHGADTLIAGWAPGGSDTIMPANVGLQVGSGGFTIEIHHFNDTGGMEEDASGLEICVSYTPRQHTAAIHWLGVESFFFVASATGTCSPTYAEGPVSILTSWPHMHKQGNHMKTTINRAGGGEEPLIDEPFDFGFQGTYDTPAVLNDGDTLTTTCTFNQPASKGDGSNDEMCFNFVVAYPAGSLERGGTKNRCFQ